MRLAILVTNTDDSPFSRARPLDDAKFADLIAGVRPDWQTEAFWVCRDIFPQDPSGFDGVMITGSPASVLDLAPWIARLEDLVREITDAKIPLFGACFGHQIIAKALGSKIQPNPEGWAHGRIGVERVQATPWSVSGRQFFLYGSHCEQVADVPAGGVRIFQSPGCPVAGYTLGHHVFTVQHHPEMTPAFIHDLVEELADYVGPAVTESARASLQDGAADGAAFAEEIARFFETARQSGG